MMRAPVGVIITKLGARRGCTAGRDGMICDIHKNHTGTARGHESKIGSDEFGTTSIMIVSPLLSRIVVITSLTEECRDAVPDLLGEDVGSEF